MIELINEKQLEKTMLCLEDTKSLYGTLEQSETDFLLKQDLKAMLKELEKHYQYLNKRLTSMNN